MAVNFISLWPKVCWKYLSLPQSPQSNFSRCQTQSNFSSLQEFWKVQQVKEKNSGPLRMNPQFETFIPHPRNEMVFIWLLHYYIKCLNECCHKYFTKSPFPMPKIAIKVSRSYIAKLIYLNCLVLLFKISINLVKHLFRFHRFAQFLHGILIFKLLWNIIILKIISYCLS